MPLLVVVDGLWLVVGPEELREYICFIAQEGCHSELTTSDEYFTSYKNIYIYTYPYICCFYLFIYLFYFYLFYFIFFFFI